MKEKILIVDDDEEILSLLYDTFHYEDYLVYTANNGDEAVEKLTIMPDIILLDVMMPGKDGFTLCREIRSLVSCPIIFLTAKVEEKDIVKGLALGGDDYITKPFSIREIRARVIAHLRRDKRNNTIDNKEFVIFDNLRINLNNRQVFYFEKEIILTKREFDIIELLALNAGQVFSKERIYESIWGFDAEGDSSTISEHVKNIRFKFQKINKDFNYINTVWGIGYKWNNSFEGMVK